MPKTYWEKLKDPRWQRKRLEAMQAANFACQACNDDESTLHVHHKQYFKGREPWEYDVGQLAVLCESCHESQHDGEDPLALVCSYLPVEGLWSRDSIAWLIVGFTDVPSPPESTFDPYAHAIGYLAAQLFDVGSSVKYDRLLHLTVISEQYGSEMLQLLLEFSKGKQSPVFPT